MASNQRSANTPSTVPSTDYGDGYDNQSPDDSDQQHEFAPTSNPSPEDDAGQQQQQQQLTGGTASTFSSPRLPTVGSNPNLRLMGLPNAVPMQHTISSVSGGNQTNSSHGAFDSTHNTPLLNGENIVLLSFSNDTTPTGISAPTPPSGGDGSREMADEMVVGGGRYLNVMTSVGEAINESSELSNMSHTVNYHADDEDGEEANDMTLSPSSILNVDIDEGGGVQHYHDNEGVRHSSPPPESVHSGRITTLSPPPLSMSSSKSYGPQPTSGSQSLFSRENNNRSNAGSNYIQQQPPTVASAGGNTPSKKRPPLPPRWAIGNAPGNTGVATSQPQLMQPQPANVGAPGGDLVDVVPAHLPPPKQIGPLSHRRVLSTGDASFLSNLTDPDSMPEGEDNSPPMAVGIGAAAGGVAPYHATTNAANATGTSNMIQPLPMNPSRRRGVSWDFGPSGAGVAASASESDGSLNRYKNEEEAAFDTLGILQPILQDDDGGRMDGAATPEDEILGDLMQPILLDDDHDDNLGGEPMVLGGTSSSAFTPTSDEDIPPSAAQHPSLSGGQVTHTHTHATEVPPPPEKVVRKHRSERSHLTKSAQSHKSVRTGLGTIPSLKDITLTKKSQKDLTQFEDEAEMAILEALKENNMQVPLAASIVRSREELKREEEPDERIIQTAPSKESMSNSVPSQVLPSEPNHRKDVSALTALDLEISPQVASMNHPPNPPAPSRVRGESIFEDLAWTQEYDAAGRIDGTLPEERDAKLVEQANLGVVDLNPRVAASAAAPPPHPPTAPAPAVASPRPPLHPLLSKKDHSRRASAESKKGGIVKDDDSASKKKIGSKGSDEASKLNVNIPKDPTAITGLRHRRTGTIAAKNMAEELAQMAALHGGGDVNNTDAQHQRSKTHLTKDGGVDNLLAGLDILAKQEEKSKDKEDHLPPTAEEDEEAPGDDEGPHDEETGDAKGATKEDRPQPNSPRRYLSKRSETMYHLRIWYNDLIRPKIPSFVKGATHLVCFVMLPLLSVAFILYYAAGNPIAGNSEIAKSIEEGFEDNEEEGFEDNEEEGSEGNEFVHDGKHASWSWWVLLFVRQAFVLSCVKAGEVVSIEILALRTPLFLKTIGSFATLMIVQARGWPYVLTFWSLSDFCVLFGSHRFPRHWLYWQDHVGLFNESNPAGEFLHSEFYMRLLLAVMFVGVSTSLKRLWLATFLGKRSYAHYGPELEVILAKMLLVSQVAHLARQIESQVVTSHVSDGYAYTMQSKKIALPGLTTDSEDENSPTVTSKKSLDEQSRGGGSGRNNGQNGFGQSLLDAGIGSKFVTSLTRPKLESGRTARLKSSKKLMSSSAKMAIMQLLEEWEEPDIKTKSASKASIKDILQFRQAVSLMDDTYPFTPAFGPASTRPVCVQSSENLFERLMQRTPDTAPLLPFETLSEIAYDANGQLLRDKVKALIKLFRPDRKGFLTKLDFVSSIDDVYKDLRLFRASLANSSSIDDSFETIINLIHFILVIFIVLVIIGFKLWEPVLSFSAFFFSFSFMFGPASSKYFEGILLIFIRRPYDIGDKIALSDPENDTSSSGSSTWFVEKVSLFTTTVRFATTNEVATYSNGSLARLRIINAKRSPKAIIYVYMKFGSDVPYKMIKVYQSAIENFVKSRPREWAQLNGFRATRVEMELNYIEYVIVATHREMWQNVGPILQSQADLASFSLEVSKKLNLRYHNPPKPITLSMSKRKTDEDGPYEGDSYGATEIQQVARLFGGGNADLGDD